MTTTLERRPSTRTTAPGGPDARAARWAAAAAAVGAAIWALATTGGESPARILGAALAAAWALSTVVLVRRGEPNAALIGAAAAIGGAGVASKDLAPFAAALLPAAGMHFFLAIPSGSLRTTARR